jgi:hypothetical protein
MRTAVVDELEQRLKIDEVYSLIYRDNVESVEVACGKAGISKATFYNWPAELRDEIKNDVLTRQLEYRREREEALERAKLDAEAGLLNKGYELLSEAMDIMAGIMRTSRSDFNKKAAADFILDVTRNKLNPDKGKTVIVNATQEEERLQLTAPEPTRWLPPPDSVTHSDDLRLASEIQTKAKFPDGSTVETRLTRPDVVDG